MSTGVSDHYQIVKPEDIVAFAEQYENAWQDPEIPLRQYEIVKRELAEFKAGKPVRPYDVLVDALRSLHFTGAAPLSLLDVGCASGYYSEVLRLAGLGFQYTGLDYSEPLIKFAKKLFNGVSFEVGNATKLRWPDNSFDVVIHGGCLMHCYEYETAIEEAIRVARQYVIFHRTPVHENRPTEFWTKAAYEIECLELEFEHISLIRLFEKYKTRVIRMENLFFDIEKESGHRTYVLEKVNA